MSRPCYSPSYLRQSPSCLGKLLCTFYYRCNIVLDLLLRIITTFKRSNTCLHDSIEDSMKHLKFIWSCFLSIFFSIGYAQNGHIDKLLKTLPYLKDSARIDCLNELGFEYSNPYWNASFIVQTDIALLYILQAQKESKKLNYLHGIGASLQNLGMVAEERGDYINSETYTRLAIPLLEKTTRQTEFKRAYVNLGWCALNRGRYIEALNILKNVLSYYLSVKDTNHIAMIYRMIGNTYINLGYTEKAFHYFQLNNEVKKNIGDIVGTMYSPNFKAKLYLIAGDTSKAVFYFRQSADSAKAMNMMRVYNLAMANIYTLTFIGDSSLNFFKQNISLINSTTTDSLVRKKILMTNEKNITEIFLRLNNYDEALAHSWKPLKEFTEGGDINQLMTVLKNIAKAYDGKRNDTKALYYTKQMLAYAEKNGARLWMQDGYLLLWHIYDRKKLEPLAYKYHLKYSSVKDFMEINNYKAKILAWDAITAMNADENNYETQLKTAEQKNNTRVALIKKEKQTLLLSFMVAVVIGILFIGILVRNIRLKTRKNQLQLLIIETNAQLEKRKIEQEMIELKMQKTELEMQALRAQMNPHFIFNSLNSINRFILQNNKSQASQYLTKFSRLVRLILQNSQSALISLESELESLGLYLELEAVRFDHHFDFTITVDKELDTLIIKLPPLVIQPYAENAIWHGLMHKDEKGHLQIELYEEKDVLCCKITDDGIGRKKANELKSKSASTHKSLGMQITANRIAMLQLTEQSEKQIKIIDLVLPDGSAGGTEVLLKIPICYD